MSLSPLSDEYMHTHSIIMCRITTEISNAAIEREGSVNSDGGTDKNVASIQEGHTLEDRSNPCQLLPRAVLLVSTNEEHTSQDLSKTPGDHSKCIKAIPSCAKQCF